VEDVGLYVDRVRCPPHPVEERSTVVRVYVCCGCLSVREHVSGTTCPISVDFHACYGRGSVLLWRRCDTLCTSGFRDDVILARSGVNRRREKGVYSKSLDRGQRGFDTATNTPTDLPRGGT